MPSLPLKNNKPNIPDSSLWEGDYRANKSLRESSLIKAFFLRERNSNMCCHLKSMPDMNSHKTSVYLLSILAVIQGPMIC